MSLETLGTFGGLVVVICTVWGLFLTVRSSARDRARQDRDERQKIRDEAYAEGVKSQAYLINDLTTQRNDAWHDRDEAREKAREWESRYMDLARDRGVAQ